MKISTIEKMIYFTKNDCRSTIKLCFKNKSANFVGLTEGKPFLRLTCFESLVCCWGRLNNVVKPPRLYLPQRNYLLEPAAGWQGYHIHEGNAHEKKIYNFLLYDPGWMPHRFIGICKSISSVELEKTQQSLCLIEILESELK